MDVYKLDMEINLLNMLQNITIIPQPSAQPFPKQMEGSIQNINQKLQNEMANTNQHTQALSAIQYQTLLTRQHNQLVEQPPIDYNNPDFVSYFKSKQIRSQSYKTMVDDLLFQSQAKLKTDLKEGSIQISEDCRTISDLLKPATIDKDDKIKHIMDKKSLLQMQLQLVKEQLSKVDLPQEKQSKIIHHHLLAPPPQHHQFVDRMSKLRKKMEEKRKMQLQYGQNKLIEAEKKKQEQKKQSEERKRIERQNRFRIKIDEIEKRKSERSEKQKQANKRFQSLITQKKRHQMMEQNYENKIVLPMLQERKKTLQQRSQRFKAYSIEEALKFEKQYARLKEEKSESSSKSREKEVWHYKPPQYSHKIQQLLQQQKIKQKVLLEQKKRALEQKISRQQNYAQYLKQSFPVKIDEKKKLQLSNAIQKEQNKKRPSGDQKKIGNKYLMQVKAKVKVQSKKDNYSMQQDPKPSPIQHQKLKSNTSLGHYDQEKYIREIHQKRISRLLSSDTIDKSQKMQQLRMEVDKLGERAKRKQEKAKHNPKQKKKENESDIEELLSSIRAKVGIMELYKS